MTYTAMAEGSAPGVGRGATTSVDIADSVADGVSLNIVGARLRDRDGLWDVAVDRGVVRTITAHNRPLESRVGRGTVGQTAMETFAQFDVHGKLLLPGFVDAHIHVDKAFQIDALESRGASDGNIDTALVATAALKQAVPLEVVESNAMRVLDMLARGGTVAARAHVEIDATTDRASIAMHLEIARRRPDVMLELTAFAQYGTTQDPRIMRNMVRAMESGCTVVAGCPYADEDPMRHLDDVIGLARDADAPLDLHLDLSDDLDDLLLGDVLTRIERAGLGGRVVLGHLTALTAAPPARVRELAAMAAGVGVAVVAIPTTDLYLSGRGQQSAPTRGVTRIKELIAAGVPVALASNNYENAFTPVSMPSLTYAAWLASLTNHMGATGEQLSLLDGITDIPRALFGADVPGLTVGGRIGAVVVDAASPVDVVRSASRPVAVVTAARGAVVHQPLTGATEEWPT